MADLSNSRIPPLMGFVIAILVFAGFGGLALLATNDDLNGNSSSSLLKEIQKQEDQISGLKSRLSKIQVRKEHFETRMKEAALLAQLTEELVISADKIAKNRASINSQQQAFEILFNKNVIYVENYRNSVRSAAVGRVFPSLEMKDGKTYKSAKVRKIDDRGMTVSLADGMSRIPYLKLPDHLQEEFQFAETEVTKLMRLEKQRQIKLSSQLEEVVIVKKKKTRRFGKLRKNAPLRKKIKELKQLRSKSYLKLQALEQERARAEEKHEMLRRAGNASEMPRAIKLLDKKISIINEELDAMNARISVATERYKASD